MRDPILPCLSAALGRCPGSTGVPPASACSGASAPGARVSDPHPLWAGTLKGYRPVAGRRPALPGLTKPDAGGTPALPGAAAPTFQNCSRDTGSVLIVVLIVCLGLVSVALLFGHSMLMAYRGEDNALAARQAQATIEGAARYAVSLLSNVTTPGDPLDPTQYQSEAVAVGEGTFWFIGEPLTATAPTDQPTFGLVDEASKLNLNRASAAMLANLPGMTDDLAQAIVAWRSAPAPGGAGPATMLDAGVKNAPFESVEELAQVNGGTPLDILYGNDTNLNHCLDPEEQTGGGAGQLASGLLEYVTVFSRESNTLGDGTKKVNVSNAGSSGALAQLLRATFTGARGDALARALRPGAGGGQQPPGSPPPPPRTFKSPLELYAASGMTADEFDKISDKLTATGGAFTTGLVNVNTASATVLACVPGIDANKAAQIVSTRQGKTQPATNLAWIVPIIGQAAAAQAGPYLTTRSYQVSADVAAVGRHGRGYRRTRFVIDSSNGSPQIVYRRDLSGLGWALGSNARQNLARLVVSPGGEQGAAR